MTTKQTTTDARGATYYVADTYGRGCPSNAAGRQVGVGLTAEDAIADCDPYANQAPWFRERARAVLAVEGEKWSDKHGYLEARVAEAVELGLLDARATRSPFEAVLALSKK